MELLATLLIAVLVAVVIFYIIDQLPLGQPWQNILKIVLALIFVVWLLGHIL